MEMNEEEFTIIRDHLVLLAGFIRDMRISEFIERCDLADAIGPILEPTLWMKANIKLDAMCRLASAALVFQKEVHRQLQEQSINYYAGQHEQPGD